MANCYLCGSSKLKVIKKELRHAIQRNVLECQSCGLVFLTTKKTNLQAHYKGDYRKIYSPVIGKESTSKEIYDMYYPIQGTRLERVKKYLNKKKRILDIGCSAGHFINTIKPFVKEVIGIEFNLDNAKFVNEKLGIKVYTEPIDKTDLPEKYFDVIFCLQTMEHMDDPLAFLKTIKRYLKDDGIIYIEVPNLDEATLSIFHNKAYGDFYYREPHLFYYSKKTLQDLMNKADYKGKVLPFQWYNFINQMHWILANGPQKDGAEGISASILIKDSTIPKKIREEINKWIKSKDEEYKKILEKHFISDQIIFIGKKK